MQERRFDARMNVPFYARFRGVDSEGNVFREETLLENLSVGGLYLQLSRWVAEGTDASVVVRLSTTLAGHIPALRLAARGRVLRSEANPDGGWGVAIQFKRRRIL